MEIDRYTFPSFLSTVRWMGENGEENGGKWRRVATKSRSEVGTLNLPTIS